MSAIRMFGRRFVFAADDLFIPAAYATCMNAPMLVIAIISFTTIQRESTCRDDLAFKLEFYRTAFLILFASIGSVDFALLATSFHAMICESNGLVVVLLYIRTIVTICLVGFTIVGSIWIGSLRDDVCFQQNQHLYDLNLALLVVSWIAAFLTLCFCMCTYNGGQGKSPGEAWATRIRHWTCAWYWGNKSSKKEEDELFAEIGEQLSEFFQLDGMVPSDVIAGLMLVKAMQVEQAKLGEKNFYKTAEDAHLFNNSHDDVESVTIEVKSEGDDYGNLARQGVQPDLSDYHWNRIRDARYFYKYSLGSYGWPLYTYMEPTALLSCSFCGCCLDLSPQQQELYEGQSCCHGSVMAFLKRTKIPKDDLLAVRLVNDLDSVCYYVCRDRERKKIVVAIRGTMSAVDCVTDLQARAVPLSEFGMDNHYTHKGILRVVKKLMNDLTGTGLLQSFLDANPGYSPLVVGHSLGAASAGLLSMLLHERFPDLRCFCYAPPLLTDFELAQSEETKDYITSIVHNKDMICRMSLRTLDKLQRQIFQAFEIANHKNKYKIWKLTHTRDYSELVDVTKVPQNDYIEHDEKQEISATDDKSHKLRPGLREDSQHYGSVDSHGPNHKARLYTPGRIYHMVRFQPHEQRSVFGCCEDPPVVTVYPADPENFQEVMIDPTLWLDHFPDRYDLRFHQLEQNMPRR